MNTDVKSKNLQDTKVKINPLVEPIQPQLSSIWPFTSHDNHKRVFLSYSHDNEEHQRWVFRFCDDLRKLGIDAIADNAMSKGESLIDFMDKGIANAHKVLIIGTPSYKLKSEKESGGVKYEDSIIKSSLLYGDDRGKYIPVLRIGEFKTSFPSSISHLVGYDMRDDSSYSNVLLNIKYEIYDKSYHQLSALADVPEFTVSSTNQSEWGDKKNGSIDIKLYPNIQATSIEKLENQLDVQKEPVINLMKKLAEYKSRKPNPYIIFEDDQKLLRFRKLKSIDIETELENFIKQLKKENPYKEYKEEKIDFNMSPQLLLATGYRIKTKEEVQNENKELDLYFKAWEKYKRFYLLKNALDKRFKKIIFKIQNKGNDQTGDMNIFVKIPDRIKIYDKNSKIWMEDTKPERFMFSISRLNPYMIDRWDTTKTIQDHELKFQGSKLNHHLLMPLNSDDPLYIDTDTCGNFEIEWTIIDSKVSDPFTGKLHVVVE